MGSMPERVDRFIPPPHPSRANQATMPAKKSPLELHETRCRDCCHRSGPPRTRPTPSEFPLVGPEAPKGGAPADRLNSRPSVPADAYLPAG